MNNLVNTRYTSLILRVTGIIFIVSVFVDFITLAIPIRLFESSWQLRFVASVVDRGIIPLLGIILFLLGYWLNSTVEQTPSKKKKKGFDFRMLLFTLAAIMGIAYLLLVPIHIRNVNEARRIALVRINQQAEQSEAQIQNQYNQIKELVTSPNAAERLQQGLAEIDQIENSEQELSAEQRLQLEEQRQRLTNFQNFVDNPELLEQEVNRLQTQLDTDKLARITETNLEAFKQSARISLNSLLLAIAYSVLGWFGLKNLLGAKSKTRPSLQ